MQYLKKELNKVLPLALLFGAIGGVLLIVISNLLVPSELAILLVYGVVLTTSVFVLNKIRYRKDTKSSVLYGYSVYAVMTIIAFLDMVMNANPDFVNPVFESITFFLVIFAAVLLISGAIPLMFRESEVS
ncbi:hypothetical protein K6119_09200 [Paracrocinitomix mangrovi]|uniref:hypothetical protein n=1 Tax=Paracrocinitomix mangrovi TaxID=2862509 RepID=UPI001C8D7740|nr:hypothetical protein [Paracrocinitomix mangrovi]UKN03688.1 hypothetical protein K6119_09200 [Paracrocinitomix mangrovi]